MFQACHFWTIKIRSSQNTQEYESILTPPTDPSFDSSQRLQDTNIFMQREGSIKETNNIHVSLVIVSMKLIW